MKTTIASDRRGFLSKALKSGGLGLSALAARQIWPSDKLLASVVAQDDARIDDEFANGEMLEVIPFARERYSGAGRVTGDGLNGRLAFDLATLDEQAKSVPAEEFFIRTRKPDGLDYSQRDPWTIRISGLVEQEFDAKLSEWLPRATSQGECVLECSGNPRSMAFGLLSATSWKGVPLSSLWDDLRPAKDATRVLIAGVDDHSSVPRNSRKGASWVFTRQQLDDAGAFLATEMDGAPLHEDHGFPVRLFVPGWYGCTCIKWVEEVQFADDSVESTSHMREFASRTHQDGTPELAKDFQPAAMDFAAMPVRVEKWKVKEEIVYRIVGIAWGGDQTTDRLAIRFGREEPLPVTAFQHASTDSWTLWSFAWRPGQAGRYRIRMGVQDESISTRRLDQGFYDRSVEISPSL